MSLEVAVRHRAGAFRLDAAFASGGGITALFGRSGAGKSTLLAAVAGLIRPDHAHIVLGGRVLADTDRGIALPRHRRRIGTVFQDGRLFPHLSVRQNLRFGRWFTPPAERYVAEADIVDLLGLAPLLHRAPSGLSGGEKQRVAIGRALLASPRALLMDEPLAALDAARKAEILPFIEALRDAYRIPILYVSHAPAEVARLADTVVVLEAGRVVASGPAAAVMAGPEVAAILGPAEAGALVDGRVARHDETDALTEIATPAGLVTVPRLAAPPGAEVRLRIHARDVMLALGPPEHASALNVLPARVAATTPLEPPTVEVRLEADGATLVAHVTGRSVRELGIRPGLVLYAVLKSVAVDRGEVGRAPGTPAAAIQRGP